MRNSMKLTFAALPENEALARMAISAFILPVNPTLVQLADVKTAVSEAVTNAIIHGYEEGPGIVHMKLTIREREFEAEVRDEGVGIADVKKAMEPLYTSKPSRERSGMGFSFMEAFMDQVTVDSKPGRGTVVRMTKRLEAGKGR